MRDGSESESGIEIRAHPEQGWMFRVAGQVHGPYGSLPELGAGLEAVLGQKTADEVLEGLMAQIAEQAAGDYDQLELQGDDQGWYWLWNGTRHGPFTDGHDLLVSIAAELGDGVARAVALDVIEQIRRRAAERGRLN